MFWFYNYKFYATILRLYQERVLSLDWNHTYIEHIIYIIKRLYRNHEMACCIHWNIGKPSANFFETRLEWEAFKTFMPSKKVGTVTGFLTGTGSNIKLSVDWTIIVYPSVDFLDVTLVSTYRSHGLAVYREKIWYFN